MSELSANEITCGYGERIVLDRLSVEVRPGEVLALLGPNGAGKTTLIRALARLLKPKSGRVTLLERDIWSLSAGEAARQIALAPQSERRDWPLAVADAVRLGRAAHRGWLAPFNREDEAAVDRALAQTELGALRARPITELSGGEWRRVVLARALAQDAGVLLLDEPTGGLDLKFQIEILSLVKRLAREQGLVVVLTLHDLNTASLFADRLALLSNRTLVAVGDCHEVITGDLISRVYGIPVVVTKHPIHGAPLVSPKDIDVG
jgi:iron complex transport system ATP-binding protein